MKAGRDLESVVRELHETKNTRKDYIANYGALEYSEELASLIFRDQEKEQNVFAKLTPIAEKQLMEKLGIPVKYYELMKTENPSLLGKNVNSWFANWRTAKAMVRTAGENGSTQARAFLSDKYRPLDNYELFEAALPALTKTGANIESLEITETRFYIKAVSPRISREVRVGDRVQAGVVISNSEVGMGSLRVEPLIYRLVCLNGAIRSDAKMKKHHVGKVSEGEQEGAWQMLRSETRAITDKAFWMRVRDTVEYAFDEVGFDTAVAMMEQSTQREMREATPIKVVEFTSERFGFNENEHNGVLANLLSSNDFTQYGLANAITRAAQDVPSYDRSTEMERIGWDVIELSRNDWSRIASA